MQVLNLPEHAGRFNISTQFPYYRETLYLPDFSNKIRGKPVMFDMDMSAGDFISLIYLLKAPIEDIDLKVVSLSLVKDINYEINTYSGKHHYSRGKKKRKKCRFYVNSSKFCNTSFSHERLEKSITDPASCKYHSKEKTIPPCPFVTFAKQHRKLSA